MSTLVRELSQTFDRIVVVAPTEKLLCKLFESWSESWVNEMGWGQKLDLQSVRLPEGKLRTWLALSAGRRAQLSMRLAFAGYSLETGMPEGAAFKNVDAIAFWVPGAEKFSRKLWTYSVPQHWREIPCVLMGPKPGKDGEWSFEDKAQRIWFERRFARMLLCPDPANFLRDGLDWVLSF